MQQRDVGVIMTAGMLRRGKSCRRQLESTLSGKEDAQHVVAEEDRRTLLELYRTLRPVDSLSDATRDVAWDAITTRDAVAAGAVVENARLELSVPEARTVLHQDVERLIPGPGGYEVILVRPLTRLRAAIDTEAALAIRALERVGEGTATVSVVYADRNYVRGDELEAERLLRESEITRRVRGHLRVLDAWIAELPVLAPTVPVPQDYRCGDPHCELCYGAKHELPATHVRHLLHGRDTARALMDRGITRLDAVPDDTDLTSGQRRQLEAVRNSRPYVDLDKMRSFLERLSYPLAFLDFEALSRIVPRHPGVRVGQHVPFLYSLHLARSSDAALVHSWGEAGDRDPRGFTQRLLADLKDARGIVAFGAAFERRMLAFLGERVPEHAKELAVLAESIVDVSQPFQRVWIYHPEQRGSLSLKRTAAALAGVSYDDLHFQDGGDANYHYASAQDADGVSTELMAQLVDYCARDTHALAALVFALERVVAHADNRPSSSGSG